MSRTATFAPGFVAQRSAPARIAQPRPVAEQAQQYAWLPAHIRHGLSPRARRLMRAGD